ncbi:MAG: trigger factor [Phycisphaerales bacterium]|nr:trigger factor [Phycisphaerales bacterium]
MVETDNTAVKDEEKSEEYVYNIKVEQSGPATRKVVVEIPQTRIHQVIDEQYRELKRGAAIPGFRAGRAPQKLVEKRFASSVKEDVRRQLISESYQQALEKNKLQPLGEPEFENPDEIKLPETGSFNYAFTVEVPPEFTMADLSGLTVKKQKLEVTDKNVDEAMKNLSEQQGTLEPVEDRGIEEGDYILADVHVKLGDEVVAHRHNAQLVVRSGRVAGIQIDDLAQQLGGRKAGEKHVITVHVPAEHPQKEIADKDVQIEVEVQTIRKLNPAVIDQPFLDQLGFANEQELRDALREQLVNRFESEVRRAMHQQVKDYLLEHTALELPAKLSDRQRESVVHRQKMNLLMSGMPQQQLEQNLAQIEAQASEQANRDLKLFFILGKVADDKKIEVDDAELNGYIAMLAAQRNRRPAKLKEDMKKDGTLSELFINMREQKTIDELLKEIKVEEVDGQDQK